MISKSAKLQVSLIGSSAGGHLSITQLMQEEYNHETEISNYK
jgi:hypothetical protein